MASPIPYLIQQGDTLSSVALKLGIKDEYYLKKYHNNNCELKNQTGGTLKAGEILLTPPPDEIKEMNQKATISQEEDEEAKKEEECKEEEEEEKKDAKKEEEAKKGEHEGKYFVVHGATCICDKAEDTSKTAKLKVTSHEKVVFNDEDGKYVATSDDTTLDPPAATFGKCTLKPSSSGNQPCAFSPAGKWQKFYEKTKIADKPLLTEISILQCTIGGKVTIKKHGQTNSVTKEHAENSTPVELAMINPAVKMPLQQPSYPEVSYITLKSIENRPDFKERSSNEEKTVEKILVRPNEMCRFEAKLGKGNKDLTSWLVYDGNSGDKENRLMVKEQQGIVLEEAFGTVGNYRIEGYGKPKQGVHDKNYASCSLDIVVQHNVLDGGVLKCIDGESFTKTIDGAVRLRKGFSAEFKANFLVPPTPDELNRLEFFVYDAAGAALNYIGGENILYFVPENSNAKYKVLAEYTDTAGTVSQQIFEGKTLKSNSVANISHPAQLVRYGEDVDFSVEKMTISFLVKDDSDLTKQEINTIKWSLDNVQIGTGRAIKIPTAKLPMGDHVVEAFCVISNAFGANAKEEDDDWHFKVVKNDVQIVGCHTQPKVGKKTKLLVKKFLFPNLLSNEKVFWDTISIENKVIGTQSIEICPSKVGLHTVKCRINNLPGKELKINVKQAKIKGMLFTDSNGIEIQKASWGQTIYIWLEQEYLTGEKVKVEVWDDDKLRNFNTSYFDDRVKTIDIPEYDGGLIKVVLDKEVKDETGDFGLLYIKVFAPLLQLKNEGKTYPVKDRLHVIKNKEIYKAHFGDEDGAQKHTVVDYDKISWFYANSRGFSKSEKLTLEVRKSTKINFTSITIPQEDTLLLTKEVEVDDSGTIKQQLKWSEIKEPRAAMLKAYGVIKDSWGAIKYNGGDIRHVADTIVITKTSQLVKIVDNKSAVMVGSAATSKGSNGVCVCKEYDLLWGNKITCDERKKVFAICKKLWPKKDPIEMANHLMVCMALETGESFSSSKGFPKATGLVQFTDSAIDEMNKKNKYNQGIKLTKEKLSKMTVLKQLEYVELYFKMWIDYGKIIENSLDMYMCIWCPAAVGKRDDFICYSEEKDEQARKKNENAIQPYSKNKSIDGEYYQEKGNVVLKTQQDKVIKKEELRPRLTVKTVSGKLNKASIYECNNSMRMGACVDTWDNFTNVKIKDLHPKIQCAAKNFINDVEKTYGIKLRIIQGYRTYDEQNNLYAQGRTKTGSKVTNAQGGESNHNFGLAIDVAEIKNGAIDWKEQEIILPKIAPIGKKWGFKWGGDWKTFKDKPHFEMVFGKTTNDLRELYKANNDDYTKIIF